MDRLSGLDASFLYLETPQTHMHVAMAAILDPSAMPGGYSFEKIVDLIAGRIHLLPPFRRRLLKVPFDLHHPVWVEDPDFDIIHHVRRVALPAPGGLEELGAMAGRITSTPLDRSRPLWEAWVIEGLQNGFFALLAKVHHSAVDGVSGAGLLVHLFDLERVPSDPRRPPPPRDVEPLPSEMDLFREAALARLKQPVELVRLAGRTAKAVFDVAKKRRDPEATAGGTPLRAPRTPFNAAVTARRNAAFSRVSLDDIKRVKNAAGSTVNDVVLAVCAGALRRYLAGRGALPETPLLAVCPISVRGSGPTYGSNTVSAMFTSLATNVADPLERLRIISQSTRGAKDEHNAIGAQTLQSWAEFAAPTTFHVAARFYTRLKLADKHRPIHNLVISNVPGPPFPIYLAGAEVVALYPMGPVMEGAGLNVTVMSYRGRIDFGFMVASELMPDVWDLARAVEPAVNELLEAACRPRADEPLAAGGG
jgi:WS/DGAT/MGAT family acyltransferase